MPSAPYPTIEDCLNAARVRLNDAIQSLGGEVLTDNAVFTLQMVNNAWQKMQNFLLSSGYTGFSRLKDEFIISAIPASVTPDPAVQNYITWAGFYNGSALLSFPVLPQDFISPLKLWERPNQIVNFRLMDQTLNGIPTVAKQSRNILWDWRDDRLCFPGSTIIWDLRLRYMAYLADFTDVVATPTQPVQIMRCLDSFSNFICAEMAGSRGDLDAKSFIAEAQAGAAQIYSRDTAQPKAIAKPAEYGKMADSFTPGNSGGAA